MNDSRGGDTQIRPATASDLADLVRIYNHYVIHTHITFDIAVQSVADRRGWFEGFAERGPHRLLVAEVSGRPAGYASSQTFRAKPAYRSSVESTIYLDPEAVGRGLGRTLYGAILQALESEDTVHRAFAGIALPNEASLALHERFGFQSIGTFREVGYKFDRYWDVTWFEKDLSGSKGKASAGD